MAFSDLQSDQEIIAAGHRFRLLKPLKQWPDVALWVALDPGENQYRVLHFYPTTGHDQPLPWLPPRQARLIRFQARLDLAGTLSYPALLRLYGYWQWQHYWVVETEYLQDGESLGDWLGERSLTRSEVTVVLSQLAGALDYLHDQGYTLRGHLPLTGILVAGDSRLSIRLRVFDPVDFAMLQHSDLTERQRHRRQDVSVLAVLAGKLLAKTRHTETVSGQEYRLLCAGNAEQCPQQAGHWLTCYLELTHPAKKRGRWLRRVSTAMGVLVFAGTLVFLWPDYKNTDQQPIAEEETRFRQQQKLQAKEIDAAAFRAARELATEKSYQAYLVACKPLCRFRDQALDALTLLKTSQPLPGRWNFRDSLKEGGDGPEMVWVPRGRFLMGSPPGERGRFVNERRHWVSISKRFAISRYEVTLDQYDRYARATGKPLPDDAGWGRGDRPVINVSLQDALAYSHWLSRQTGYRYRLPTEAEWEYAARGGNKGAQFWGNRLASGCGYANAADEVGRQSFPGWKVMPCKDGYVFTAPVGMYRANNFQLHDVLGNVWEWTCSVYRDNYDGTEKRCARPVSGVEFVARGGAWSDAPERLRLAERLRIEADSREYFLGFRVVREQQRITKK